jgi:putative addiction module component (TIGR02574 family)
MSVEALETVEAPATVDALMKQIAELPSKDRDLLLDRLHGLYRAEREEAEFIEIDDATRAMLEERLAEHDANPNEGYTWEEVLAYVHRKK